MEMGRQAVTCSQVPEGEDDVSVGSLLTVQGTVLLHRGRTIP